MKLIHFLETKEFKNSNSCVANEYSFNDSDINVAIVKISGRYPDNGRTMNEKCKEIGYVINGSGKIIVDGSEFILKKGDTVLIEPGEKFFWEGNLTMVMPCTPAWSPEQHKLVD